MLETYQDFKSQLAAKGTILEDNGLSSSAREFITSRAAERYVRATVFKGRDRNSPVLVPNQFPYWTLPGIEHWVLWSQPSVGPSAEIRAAITAQRPASVRRVFWFENPPAAKTVPGIWHVHVFLRAPL